MTSIAVAGPPTTQSDLPLDRVTMSLIPSPKIMASDIESVISSEMTTTEPASSSSSSKYSVPLPNPPFVFPAHQPTSSSTSSSSARVMGRRPLHSSVSNISAGGTMGLKSTSISFRRGAPPPLPAFNFNSGILTKDTDKAASPNSPDSPQRGMPIPLRSVGHRRGGSEFVGGDGVSGVGMGLMSTSPTKGDGSLPAPPSSSIGPAPGRRGHAHRRSAAMSCHDLTAALNPPTGPNPVPRGGSAPTSPSDSVPQQFAFPKSWNTTPSPQSPPLEPDDASAAPTPPPGLPSSKGLSRARVGFSDDVEVIPRPLSMVSNDTSSTVTFKPGHSVSGSLSSMLSADPSSPSTKDSRRHSPPSNTSSPQCRPKTAGAILGGSDNRAGSRQTSDSPSSCRRNSSTADGSFGVNGNVAASPSSPMRRFFLGHGSGAGEPSHAKQQPISSESRISRNTIGPGREDSVGKNADVPLASVEEFDPITKRSSMSRKPSKSKKKTKLWSGSILTRKSRSRSHKQKVLSRRSPTPPLRPLSISTDEPEQVKSMEQVIPETAPAVQNPPRPQVSTDFTSWKPRHVAPPDDDSSSPMIDLDAALGPFRTPSTHDPLWEAAQRAPAHVKRRMHSAMGVGSYIGPGMNFHKRAESAPEMVAFENPRFPLHRLGSSSTMDDVFEEDEEEEDVWEEMKATPPHTAKSIASDDEENDLGIGIKVVDAEVVVDGNSMNWSLDEATNQREIKRSVSGVSELESRQVQQTLPSMKSEHSTSLAGEPVVEERSSVIESADGLVLTRQELKARLAAFCPPQPLRPQSARSLNALGGQSEGAYPIFGPTAQTPSTIHSTSPSPRSPMYYDGQRVSTAPSSVTDDGFQSLMLGEPGPEVRGSVDDVPSLSSSHSTATRDSTFNTIPGSQLRDAHRSGSLSSIAASRKRTSIASLSRLISSSHGEKSKLSIEARPPSSPEKKEKIGKSKRISRMMQFWKPKDTSS